MFEAWNGIPVLLHVHAITYLQLTEDGQLTKVL